MLVKTVTVNIKEYLQAGGKLPDAGKELDGNVIWWVGQHKESIIMIEPESVRAGEVQRYKVTFDNGEYMSVYESRLQANIDFELTYKAQLQ